MISLFAGRRWPRRRGRRRAVRVTGGTRSWCETGGFTLIELMIVTVLLGILAMIAVPIYQGFRRDAARAALQQQLRTLAQAQRMYHFEHDVYTDDVDDLDYQPAQDLQLEVLVESGGGGGGGSSAGWSARLTDPDLGVRCAIVHGDATSFAPATVEAEIACDEGG